MSGELSSQLSSQLFLGIDVGSGSVRAGIFDSVGVQLAFSVKPIQQFHPRSLHVEQSSADIWAQTGAADHDITMWMDRRAAEQTAAINATGDEALAYVGGEVVGIEMELPKAVSRREPKSKRFTTLGTPLFPALRRHGTLPFRHEGMAAICPRRFSITSLRGK